MNTSSDILLTDHMIDEMPESQTTLELLHHITRFSHLNCTMARDQRSMEYAIGDLERRNQYLQTARLTILMFKLPLEATLVVVEKFACVTKATLIIQYTGK